LHPYCSVCQREGDPPQEEGSICINDIKKLPDNEQDGMIMMDVLEYIEEDKILFNNVINKIWLLPSISMIHRTT
jgi:hypothetical protein